ncbi:hypothetical protein GZL_08433 [Streptomyces sp. 769]|nr:hypothetical protein GZL_08433 [Streptomyces sp. 769]
MELEQDESCPDDPGNGGGVEARISHLNAASASAAPASAA